MISKFRLIAGSLLFYFAIAIQAHAQAYDGTYRGTIACDPIPGVTAGPLKTLFTLRVAGDVISYEREVIRPTGEAPLGITESGSGSINGHNELIPARLKAALFAVMRGIAENWLATPFASPVRRSGRIDKPTPHTRPCTIELIKSN